MSFISEETLLESSVIQYFLQQGVEQGIIESILANLELRFNPPNSQAIITLLERIEDMEQLRQLRREAFQAQNLDAFLQALIAQEIQQTTRRTLIENILESLKICFNTPNLDATQTMLEGVETVEQLQVLRREALQAQRLEDFTKVLAEYADRTES